MFPQFAGTSETLSKAASSLVFRIGTDAHLYDDPEDVNIGALLESRFDSEKCEALKRLLALIAQGFDVSNFFPQVVKNVASQSLEVKKLVYLYLLHYAEKRPNEALLSINCFQKDLGDPNPLVRAWALRAMAGIRLHVISPLVLVAVGKCARDPSVFVRKCAANALPKLHELRQEEITSAIEEIVGILLNDRSPGVVGAAAAAFASICPNNFTLIGRNYRNLCQILPDVEEWGQILLIEILLRYVVASHGLVKESIMSSLLCIESSHSEKDVFDVNVALEDNGIPSRTYDSELVNLVSRSYIEGLGEYLTRSSDTNARLSDLNGARFTSGQTNDDVKLLLQCTSPLLWSHNSAVVLAAAGVHWIMSPKEDIKRIVKPLLFILRSSGASKYVVHMKLKNSVILVYVAIHSAFSSAKFWILVLCNIQVFAKALPHLFVPHYEDFFVSSSDSYQSKALKLEILSSIVTESSISSVFKEFQDYIRDPDRRFAADTVAAIGLCARRLPKMANTCVEGLLALIRQELLTSDIESGNGEADVLIQSIISIKSIIKQDPSCHEKLFRSLDSIKVPEARVMIIWMVGEYSSVGVKIPRMLTTVLKYLAWCFKSEAVETKLQILNTTIKVLLCAKGGDMWTITRLFSYLLELAECDLNYDVRDRARFFKKLFSHNLCSQVPEETNALQENKDLPLVLVECIFRKQENLAASEPINDRFYLPGSLSQIVLHAAPGYEPLPKPCSSLCDDLGQFSNSIDRTTALGEEWTGSSSNGTDDPDTSGSLDEESGSNYDSQQSITGLSDNSGTGDSASESDRNCDPLIQISDAGIACSNENGASHSGFTDLEGLMSKRALESWLDEQPGSSSLSASEQIQVRQSSARISIGNIGRQVKAKSYTLLDPANGNGLKVYYSFSSEASTISPQLVCLETFFENCSSETMSEVTLVDEESHKALDLADLTLATTASSLTSQSDLPTLVPMEEITSLEPGQTMKRILEVRFHHHLLPLKLALHCNGKKLPVKLRPDIGYFIKPVPMDMETFIEMESRLPGMFEYARSCTFTDHLGEVDKDTDESSLLKDKYLVICESLASKMLSNANIFLVSVDMPVAAKFDDASGLSLRFSSEILGNSVPCLITITVEGKCSEPLKVSAKVNCEETVFGLNLLNRIVNFLVESSLNT
ncbi:AP3-complex subunit beta-A [Citrus sinensis]|uniref:AP3-complex subunit beta-A n=1 Tax=Citrus sinensis TaxID=2711 RepID=A0ACB8L0A1_CITSI|nr:AP3-complex subunit beta-A [Citrus sinensis]